MLSSCPLCNLNYKNLSQHLKVTHQVKNGEELRLLLSYSSGRYKGTEDLVCQICDLPCKRLDRHLAIIHKLSASDLQDEQINSKRIVILKRLHQMKKNNANPPLVTKPEELGRVVATSGGEQSNQNEEEEEVDNIPRDVSKKLRKALEENKELRQQIAVLRERIKRLESCLPVQVERKKCEKTKHQSSETQFEKVMSSYEQFLRGPCPTPKRCQNARQRVETVRQFMNQAFKGSPTGKWDSILKEDVFFGYIKTLKEHRNYRPTTIVHKLVDLSSFFGWIKEAGPDGLRITRKALKRALLLIKLCTREEVKNRQAWQQEVHMLKSEKLLDPAAHEEFVRAATEVLPKILQKLQRDSKQLELFFGLLGGVMIATSGHRPGVVMNLTVEEFKSAKGGKDGHAIFVKKHKTCGTFGHAILPITKGEYNCMAEFLKIRHCFEGGQSPHFFFNSKGGVFKGLLKAFTCAWEFVGLPSPAPTFMALRTSMSTQVQKHLSHREVQNATALMCHRPQTALKFYKAYCSVEEALKLRKSMSNSIQLSRKQMVESGSSLMSNEGLVEDCDERNVCPVETMETVKSVALQCTAKAVKSKQGDQETETVIPQGRHPHQDEESVSIEAIGVFSSGADEKTQEPTEETVFVSDNGNTVEATTTSSTAEQEELIKSPPANKICGRQRRAAQTSKKEMAKAPAVLSLIEEENLSEEVFDQPAVDTSPHLPVTEEHTETMVKSVRGNRNTKQSKMTVVVEVHRVADPEPSVAVVSSRERNAVTKAKSEVTENVASSEKPVKPVKHTRRTAKAPGSKKENTIAQADSEFVAANENVKLLRRGKAVAPSAPKTSTTLKRKSNVVIEVADEINEEPLPKRRGRVASSSEIVAEFSTKEKTSEAEPKKAKPTLKKIYNRVSRGQKMTAQEPDPAPSKAQASVSGINTRKVRSVKK